MGKFTYPVEWDRPRNFHYGMSAINKAEKRMAKPFIDVLSNINGLTMNELGILAWAGLEHEDATLTPERVMRLVDDHSGVKNLIKIIMEATRVMFGIGTDGEDDGDEKNE